MTAKKVNKTKVTEPEVQEEVVNEPVQEEMISVSWAKIMFHRAPGYMVN